jgi:hypothetical protein
MSPLRATRRCGAYRDRTFTGKSRPPLIGIPSLRQRPGIYAPVTNRFDQDNAMHSATIKPVISLVMVRDRLFRVRSVSSACSIATREEEE